MSVFRSLEEARGRFGPCALAIGNFDGVHAGHAKLIEETIACAKQKGLIPAILTFHPHPTAVVAPNRTPELICSLEERIRLLFRAGIQHVMVLPFTPTLAAMSPAEFVQSVLTEVLDIKVVLVGENFVFGCRQSGNCATLEALGARLGFEARFLEPVFVRGQLVSSSAIRQRLRNGAISHAGRLLGRCYSVRGPVISGQGIGAKQTVPTLNQAPNPGQVYPRGVFVTETVDEASGRRWPSITNIGVRPTFAGGAMTIETYLLKPLEGEAPSEIEVSFYRFLRTEQAFPDADALKAQILRDVSRAQAFWRLYDRSRTVLSGYTGSSVSLPAPKKSSPK